MMWTVHPQIQHVQTCTAWSHFITRTRVAQELQSSGSHIFVSLKQLSSTCHVSFLAAPETDHKHNFSLTHFIHFSMSFRQSHQHKQDLWFSTHIYPPMFHDRVADQHKSHLSQVMSPIRWRSKLSTPKRSSLKTSSPEELSLEGILGQIRIKYRKDLYDILLLKIWMNLERLVQRRPTSSHRCIPMTTQRRALQTRILKMANYAKCWLHHCVDKIERIVRHLEYQLHRGNLLQWYGREEQVHSVLKLITQEERERERAWRQVHLRNREQRWNLLQCFRQEMRNPETISSVLCSNLLTRQIGEDLFMKAMKIISSVRQDLNLWDENIKLDLSIVVSVRFSNKLMLKDWNYRTHNTDFSNVDENKCVHKKNYLWRKRFCDILKSEVCTKGEKWRELKNCELTKSQCKNWEKIIWDNTKAYFSVAGNARTNEFYEWFGRISWCRIKLQWEIVLRFQSACNDSKFSFHAEPRRTPASWHTEYIGITGKRFW